MNKVIFIVWISYTSSRATIIGAYKTADAAKRVADVFDNPKYRNVTDYTVHIELTELK